jgi:hypothetical protein
MGPPEYDGKPDNYTTHAENATPSYPVEGRETPMDSRLSCEHFTQTLASGALDVAD